MISSHKKLCFSIAVILLIALPASAANRKCLQSIHHRASSPDAILDFDGDGLTDLAQVKTNSNTAEFTITKSSDSSSSNVSLNSGNSAPGDYDGDGVWDLGVVNRTPNGFVWETKLSTTGNISKTTFGQRGTILTGCKFISKTKTSLAYIKDRKLFAREVDSPGVRRVGFGTVDKGDVLGCADLNDDGIVDPIFRLPGPTFSTDALASVGCSNESLVYRNVRRFQGGGIIDRGSSEFPLIIVLRPAAGGRNIVDLEAMAEVFSFRKIFVPKGTTITSGQFKVSDTTSDYALQYHEPGTNDVKRIFLTTLTSDSIPGIQAGYTLVKAQNVYSQN